LHNFIYLIFSLPFCRLLSAPAVVICRGGPKRWPKGNGPPVRTVPPPPPNEIGCKVARLHNTCIHSVASHSWCQITPFTQSCIMSSGILAPPQIQMWPPQTAAGRNALGYLPPFSCHCFLFCSYFSFSVHIKLLYRVVSYCCCFASAVDSDNSSEVYSDLWPATVK